MSEYKEEICKHINCEQYECQNCKIDELVKLQYSEGYTDSLVLFQAEIKKFINTHDRTLHTDFSRGYQQALNDLLVYFIWRGIITDENPCDQIE